MSLVAPDGPLVGAMSFGRDDVLRELCERLVPGADVWVVERIADALVASDLAVEVEPERRPVGGGAVVRVTGGRLVPAGGDDRRWAARAALRVDREVLEIAARLASAPHAGQAPVGAAVEAALARRPGLSVADASAVNRLVWSGAGLNVVSSSAWTDTAAVLDTARDIWQASGREVLAAGSSRRALGELEAQTGIAGLTLPLDGPAPPGCTIVVLEAHLLGARDLVPVLLAAAEAEGIAVLVGDRNAIPSRDHGNLLERLSALVPSVELAERVAPAGRDRAREGGVEGGAFRHNQVALVASALAAREELVAQWWERQRGGGRARRLDRVEGRHDPGHIQDAGAIPRR